MLPLHQRGTDVQRIGHRQKRCRDRAIGHFIHRVPDNLPMTRSRRSKRTFDEDTNRSRAPSEPPRPRGPYARRGMDWTALSASYLARRPILRERADQGSPDPSPRFGRTARLSRSYLERKNRKKARSARATSRLGGQRPRAAARVSRSRPHDKCREQSSRRK